MPHQSLTVCPHCQGEYRNVQQHIKYIHPEHWDLNDGPIVRPTGPKRTTISPFEEMKQMLKDQNEMLLLMKLNRDLRADANGEKPAQQNSGGMADLQLFEKLKSFQEGAIREDRERMKAIKEELKLENVGSDDFGEELIKTIIGGATNAINTRTDAGGHDFIPQSDKQPDSQNTGNARQNVKDTIKGL